MTRSTSCVRLRASHLTVRSLRSGRTVPQPKYSWMSSSTSLRSPFWLTDRLGLTSQPTHSVGRGEMETVKHPSPSTYPEMYDGRSVPRASREPAYCSSRGFAMCRPYGRPVTGTEAPPRRVKSLRGHASRVRQRTSHGITRRLSPRPWSRQPGRASPL